MNINKKKIKKNPYNKLFSWRKVRNEEALKNLPLGVYVYSNNKTSFFLLFKIGEDEWDNGKDIVNSAWIRSTITYLKYVMPIDVLLEDTQELEDDDLLEFI